MIPAHLITVAQFPLTASGKIDRHALPAPVIGSAPAGEAPASSVAITATESLLAGIFAAVLHRADIGATDNFFESGGNSLQVMRLIDLIAARINAELTPVAVFLHPTPRRLAAHIDAAAHDPTDLISLTPGSGSVADSGHPGLVLIHPIGGTITDYTTLAAELATTCAVFGLQAPGLTCTSFAPATLTELVERYVDLIEAVQPDGPYRLGGWSMGGVLAYEITRLLERNGGRVGLLVLLDPPYAVPPSAGLSKALVTGHFVADVIAGLGRDRAEPPDPAATSAAAQLRWLTRQLGAEGMDEQLTRRFEVFARHADLLAGYRPAADGAARAPALLVSARRSLNAPASRCWLEHLRGPTDTLVVDSDHYEFLRPPLVGEVARAIGTL